MFSSIMRETSVPYTIMESKKAEALSLPMFEPPSRQRFLLRNFLVQAFYICIMILCFLLILDLLVFPLIVYHSSTVRQKLVFRNYLSSSEEFSDPRAYGLNNAYNTRLPTEDDVSLGVWCIPSAESTIMFNHSKVLIFCHGDQDSRAASYYVEKYKTFTELGLDVVAFDYRGYGDSTGRPSVEGLVNDSLAIYQRVRRYVKAEDIILWGHSLGAAVVMELLQKINEDVSVVLEAPFDTVGNAVYGNSMPMRMTPWYKSVYVDSLNGDPITKLDSVSAVRKIQLTKPLLMMAAQDDTSVPAALAAELYRAFKETRGDIDVQYKVFKGDSPIGNTGMHRDPEFNELLELFLQAALLSNRNESPEGKYEMNE